MSRVADHAYSHCLGVLGDQESAAEAAAIAVRHGGRTRWVVLAHARHEALRRAAELATSTEPARDDMASFARALAGARPPAERALLDLADRHGLDRGALGRVWGVPPADVAAEVAAISEVWAHELDPLLLAWMGPGECGELATLLADTDRELEAITVGIRQLLPQVRPHVERCELCGDRLRAMATVRTVLAAAPLESAPAGVAATSRRRRRRPVPEPDTTPRRSHWRLLAGTAAAVLMVAIALAVVVAARDDQPDSVAALTAVPAGGSALALEPNAVSGPDGSPVFLHNRSSKAVTWRSQSKNYLRLTPASGELAPGARTRIDVTLGDNAPEGELRTTVTFSGTDGSSVALQYAAAVERPPGIDARAEACAVTAAVEDDAEVASVLLHWRSETDEPSVGMVERDDVWAGVLPSSAAALVWWVSATDARGNGAATPTRELAPYCGRT